ncbi:glycosyltransferase family 2 protein [Lentisphaera profundi]|uniref:Glycosyltransferase family 2 protein n=1 Tax=Lentisphaera profundi TaxID=1658616 RepID=A0ABY7W0I9_9BACT|nr:glycosyltransferase family 2 protein [Lentisphaera profundi]WDE98546.1 glycosyltransferase family 2 protein [Lentisphaera profundi]
MKILIGMLIHNEEDIIADTLKTVFTQDIFNHTQDKIEMIIVANACSDNSAAIAEFLLREFKRLHLNFTYRVVSKEEPGKIAAWNDLIHLYSDPDYDYIICMDGDIIIQQNHNFSTLIDALERNSEALISSDLPIKDISLKAHKGLRNFTSLAFSKITQKGTSQLCGQLYCARADFLKQIYIPPEVLIDDTYIKFMACTGGLKHSVDDSKIISLRHISHIFEAYTGVKDYFNNQVRQTVGFSLWRIFKEIIKNDLINDNAIQAVKKRALENPEWLKEEMLIYFAQGKKWYIYSGALSVRFKRLTRLSFKGKLKMIIPVICAWLVDIAVVFVSNQKIKNSHLQSLWSDTKSKKIAQDLNAMKLRETRFHL